MRRENPIALPQEVIDARLVSWRIQIEQIENRKMERKMRRMESALLSTGFQGVEDEPEPKKETASQVAMETNFEDEDIDLEEEECVLTFE